MFSTEDHSQAPFSHCLWASVIPPLCFFVFPLYSSYERDYSVLVFPPSNLAQHDALYVTFLRTKCHHPDFESPNGFQKGRKVPLLSIETLHSEFHSSRVARAEHRAVNAALLGPVFPLGVCVGDPGLPCSVATQKLRKYHDPMASVHSEVSREQGQGGRMV